MNENEDMSEAEYLGDVPANAGPFEREPTPGSEESRRLADFCAKVEGDANVGAGAPKHYAKDGMSEAEHLGDVPSRDVKQPIPSLVDALDQHFKQAAKRTASGVEFNLGRLGDYEILLLNGSDHERYIALKSEKPVTDVEFCLGDFLERLELDDTWNRRAPLQEKIAVIEKELAEKADAVENFRALAENSAEEIAELKDMIDDLEADFDIQRKQIAAALADRDEAKTAWIRARADLENNQRRAKKDQEIAKAEIVRGVTKDLVDVLDSLSLVLGTKDARTGELVNGPTSGVAIVRDQLVDVLSRRGVKPIGVKTGDRFDTTRHEVVLVEDQRFGWSDCGVDQVCEVVFDGYSLGETILRPGRVRVRKPAPPMSSG